MVSFQLRALVEANQFRGNPVDGFTQSWSYSADIAYIIYMGAKFKAKGFMTRGPCFKWSLQVVR